MSGWGRAATNDLLRNRIRISSLNFMQGHTFLRKYIILDEVQNLTAKQLISAISSEGQMARAKRQQNNKGANLGVEAKLFLAADKLRGNLEPSGYKHVVLGLIFLKYISDAFEAKHAALLKEQYTDPEDPEEYLKEARWFHLQVRPSSPPSAGSSTMLCLYYRG